MVGTSGPDVGEPHAVGGCRRRVSGASRAGDLGLNAEAPPTCAADPVPDAPGDESEPAQEVWHCQSCGVRLRSRYDQMCWFCDLLEDP